MKKIVLLALLQLSCTPTSSQPQAAKNVCEANQGKQFAKVVFSQMGELFFNGGERRGMLSGSCGSFVKPKLLPGKDVELSVLNECQITLDDDCVCTLRFENTHLLAARCDSKK